MAEKDKVPQIVVEMIVRLRNDKYHKWGYDDIAKEIKKEFGIQITKQTVYYHYSRNKDLVSSDDNQSSTSISKKISTIQSDGEISTPQSNDIPNVAIKRNFINKEIQRKEFIETSDEDFENFLKGE